MKVKQNSESSIKPNRFPLKIEQKGNERIGFSL